MSSAGLETEAVRVTVAEAVRITVAEAGTVSSDHRSTKDGVFDGNGYTRWVYIVPGTLPGTLPGTAHWIRWVY